MLTVIFISMFCACLSQTNEMNYMLYPSGNDPNILKVKIGGAIDLGNSPQDKEDKELNTGDKDDNTGAGTKEDADGEDKGQEEISRDAEDREDADSLDREDNKKEEIDTEDNTDETKTLGREKNKDSYILSDSEKAGLRHDVLSPTGLDNQFSHENEKVKSNNTTSIQNIETNREVLNDSLRIGLSDLDRDAIKLKAESNDEVAKGNSESENDVGISQWSYTWFPNGSEEVTAMVESYNTSSEENRTRVEFQDDNHKEVIWGDLILVPLGSVINEPTGRDVTQISYKIHHQKVEDDPRVRKFIEHVYKQALKVFEKLKRNVSPHIQKKIQHLTEIYKQKFTEFVQKTRQTDIKTSQGARNVMLHTLNTSNLIMKRIMNFLKSDINNDYSVPKALRDGGALKLDKEIETMQETEYKHACKRFGVCQSSDGFRTVLQDILSLALKLPDHKLLQLNDAMTEILKHSDLTNVADSVTALYILNRALRTQERIEVTTLRSNLEVLYGALSKSHLPLVVDKTASFTKRAVKRTLQFRKLIDALEVALPPTEDNKSQWAIVKDRLNRWKDDAPLDIQDIMRMFVDNVQKGLAKDIEVKRLVEEIAESNASAGDLF